MSPAFGVESLEIAFFKQQKNPPDNEQQLIQIPILLQEDIVNAQHEYTLDEAVRATSE